MGELSPLSLVIEDGRGDFLTLILSFLQRRDTTPLNSGAWSCCITRGAPCSLYMRINSHGNLAFTLMGQTSDRE